MIGFYGGLTAAIVVLSLLVGTGSHAARPAALGEALRAHGVLGPQSRRLAAVVLPVTEGALGVVGVAALTTGHQRLLQSVLAAGAALLGLYALYTRHVLALGRGGPCGCSRRDLPLSRWVTRRAAALAGLAAAGAIIAGAGTVRLSTAELVTLMLAAPSCTALLWTLPAAMHEPAPAPVMTAPAAAHDHPPSNATVHRTTEGVSPRWISPPAP
ncbi:MauE/DoxX family redox-associated membrane protein [Actinacidiphila glaucinigra]|uniref:MauE/DoxX family redox-associated membrane protein n=1 Tax=Actinacidiphila glaucinigra TaxID=235986 RepID=UPI00379A55B2